MKDRIETFGSLKWQVFKRHPVCCLRPKFHLLKINVAALWMDLINNVIVINKWKLIGIQSFHASSFELSESNLLVSGIAIQLLV